MRRLLITGGAGFIGANLVRKAVQIGYTVLNIDALTYSANLKNLSDISQRPNYRFIKANICDKEKFHLIFDDFQPNAIIHLAAETHVDNSIHNPAEFVKTNINGTTSLLQVGLDFWKGHKKADEFKFIHVSTDEVFGSLNDFGVFTENSPYSPNSPYSATKAGSDFLVKAWYETYGFPAIVTNCSNNYGRYQFSEKLIPKTIKSILQNKEIEIYGNGMNIRDWLHVNDHCDALLLLLEKGQIGSQYVIGGNNQINNLELVQKICRIISDIIPEREDCKKLINFVTDRPGHDYRYAIDASKIQNELNWRPSIDFPMGLEETTKWYIENTNWWKN